MKGRRIVSDLDGRVRRLRRINRARCGCPKLAYANRKDAAAAAKTRSRATGHTLIAYHCTDGHCWHIGHPTGLWHGWRGDTGAAS